MQYNLGIVPNLPNLVANAILGLPFLIELLAAINVNI